jgi:transcription initiation factor TFIIIB Brf1 subunit/transcription initiation factor TFIIB
VPRPLEDFLRCSRAEERRVRRVAWRLKEEMRLGRRPGIEDYVKTLAARVGLPAPVVKAAVELWRGIGRFWPVRIRGFLRRPLYGWRR